METTEQLCEICSKLKIKTPERHQRHSSLMLYRIALIENRAKTSDTTAVFSVSNFCDFNCGQIYKMKNSKIFG